jgi:hypothetical protein
MVIAKGAGEKLKSFCAPRPMQMGVMMIYRTRRLAEPDDEIDYFLRLSMARRPGPAKIRNRKTKQYRIAASPPLLAG